MTQGKYKIHISAFTNEVLLEHCHTHSFVFCLGCLCATMAELHSCDWDQSPKTLKYLLHCPLHEKFADP